MKKKKDLGEEKLTGLIRMRPDKSSLSVKHTLFCLLMENCMKMES